MTNKDERMVLRRREKMAKELHTPLPWGINAEKNGEYEMFAGDETIMCNYTYDNYAPELPDAAFIVRAVNNHEKLLDALEEAYGQVKELCQIHGHPAPSASFERYEAAIQQARGEK